MAQFLIQVAPWDRGRLARACELQDAEHQNAVETHALFAGGAGERS